jgi:predicted ATPase
MEAAVALYQGEFLAGFHLPDCPTFEEWLLFKREHYQRLALESLSTLARVALAEGNYAKATTFARRQLEVDNLLESAHRQVMEALAKSGQRNAALAHYQKCREILIEELGAMPEEETEELYRQIRDGSLKAEPAAQPWSTNRIATNTVAPANDLPHLITPLLGRTVEMKWLHRSLGQEHQRLVTLVGPGGSGKTHLALHAAHVLQSQFPQGAYFVSLVAATSIQQVVGAIADGLKLTFQSSQLTQAQLIDYLRGRHLLLILDNFEHVLSATDVVSAILQQTPQVALLVTSRERLNLNGEQLLVLGGLKVPASSTHHTELEHYGAIQLFVQSAQRTVADFTLDSESGPYVAKIVRLLEGLPLAIELAAAWVRMLPSRTIAEEIEKNIDFLTAPYRNFPERHRSMRAVFDYSWHLASPVEQAAMRRLAFLVGGFDRKAAKEIAGVSLPVLLSLLDKSLLQSNGEGRYRWHPIVRQYAEERLDAERAEREEIWPRFGHYYLDMLQQRAEQITGRLQKQVLQEIDQELDNIQLLWQWIHDQGDLASLDMALYTLYQFYRIRGRLEELIELFDKAIAFLESHIDLKSGDPESGDLESSDLEGQEVYWHLLVFLASSLIYVAGYERAEGYLPRLLAHLRSDESPFLRAFSLKHHAMLFVHRGRFAEARQFYEQSLALYQVLGDENSQADVLNSLGVASNDLGEFSEAMRYLEESIALNRLAGNNAGLVYALSNRGASAYNIQQYAEARRFHSEALEAAREVEFRPGIMLCLLNLADVACGLREFETARSLAEEGLALTKKNHDPRQAVWARSDLGLAELGLGNVDAAREHFCRGIAAGLAIKVTPRALEAFVGLAHWMVQTGAFEDAIELLSFCLHHPNLQRKIRDRANRLVAVIQQRLDSERLAAACARGRVKSLEPVASEVLAAYNAVRTPPITIAIDAVW